ncbi:serine/threonine-protein kinase ULK4 [Stigmatopora nigra]
MENINLYEELGKDCVSVVYKGRRMGTLNYIALKCSEKSKRPEITNHVRLSKDLDHPNIVRFYEWYETRKHLWLVVELCTGGSLESVIIRDGCLPEDVVRKFGWDLIKGLEHIHMLQIVFSDLTPSEILLDSGGTLKFSNFCHSKTERETFEDVFSLCSSGDDLEENYEYDDVKKIFHGSPTYMAPEVLQGSETSFNSDIWSLGCILYYMFTGKPPFCSVNYNELNILILHHEPPPPIQIGSPSSLPSQSFRNLLSALLTKNPNDRMKWPELFNHHFWSHEQNKEDDLEEVEDYDHDDDEEEDEKNGRDSGVSAEWGCKMIHNSFLLERQADICPYTEMASSLVTKASGKSTSSWMKKTNRPDSKTETHTVYHSVMKSQELVRKYAENTKRKEVENNEDGTVAQQFDKIPQPKESFTLVDPSDLRPKSDMVENTISLLSTCEISRETCSISDSLNSSPSQRDVVKTTNGNEITSMVKALLHTESDLIVSPIMDKAKIPKSPAIQFDSKILGVPAYTVDQLLLLSKEDWSIFIEHLCSSLEGQKTSTTSTAIQSTMDLLCYLCFVVKDKEVANRLMNSKMPQSLNLLLQQARNWDVRSILLRVLGLLAQHCTELEANNSVSEVVSTISELLKDNLKNSQANRFLLPPLGEFLYLIASQEKRGSPEGLWFVPAAAYTSLMRSLREGDDSIVHHMAAKTIENICTTVSGPSRCLMTVEIGSALWHLYTHSSVGAVRLTSISALSRLSRGVPTVFLAVMEACGPAAMLEAVNGAEPKVQQHLLTAMATALVDSHIQTQRIRQISDFVLKVLHCLESPSTVTRAKTFLLLLILIKDSTHTLVLCCKHRLVMYLERDLRKTTTLKDHLSQSEYLSQCLDLLSVYLRNTAPRLLEEILSALKDIIGSKDASLSQSTQLKHMLPSTSVLLALLSSQTLRSNIVTEEFLTNLGSLLETVTHVESNQTVLVNPLGTTISDEWIRSTLSIVEVLSPHHGLISPYRNVVADSIIPPLTTLVFSKNEEWSAFVLRILSDLSLIMVDHEDDCDVNTKNIGETMTKKGEKALEMEKEESPSKHLCDLFTETLFPRYESLLCSAEPISLYALKLLVTMTENSSQMCRMILDNGILPTVLKLIEDNSNTTSGVVQNALALLCNLSQDSVLAMEPEHQEGLMDVVVSALSQSAFVHLDEESTGRKVSHLVLQALLEVLHNILTQTANVVRSALQSQRLSCPAAKTDAAEKLLFAFRPLSQLSPHLIHMLCTESQDVWEESVQCLSLLVQLYGGSHECLSPSCLRRFSHVLCIDMVRGTTLNQRTILKIIKRLVQNTNKSDWLQCPEGADLLSQLQDMTSSTRYHVDLSPLAVEILQEIAIKE